MAIAKVIFNDGSTQTTWMDVTQDTVEAGNLLAGETATRNDGVSITGTVVTASPYDSNPAMNGTASAGSSTAYSRGDHVHPSDTSRVPTTRTINGKALTSDISLTASDVGALPSSTSIPSKTSDLTNDSGFITSAGAPVQSVNGQTGAVTLSVPSATSDLTNDSGFITASDIPDQIYYVEIGGTVTWSEVVAAYNAGKLIVGYYDPQSGTRGYLNLEQISIDSSSGNSSLDSLSFSVMGNTGSTAGFMGARWAGANVGWSYYDYTLATQTYVSNSITAAIGTAIAASY